jgi:cystathionine beta-lyase
MDFPIAEPIREAILGILEREDGGYPGVPSLRALGTAFAERMSDRFGWEPAPSRVQAVGDVIQAMMASVATFCPPGGGVVIQTPIYPPFLQIVDLLGRRLVENPLVLDRGRYEMDLDALRQAIDAQTRLILFCNPHNPTGRVFERSELEGLAELVLEHDLVVVSDEIHSDLAYPGAAHIPFGSLGPEIASRTITLTGAGKAFNIAGMKCALIHFGARELRKRQTAAFDPRLLGLPNVFGIEATLAAWRDGGEWLATVVRQLDANRHRVAAFLGEHLPGIGSQPPEATYLTWLDCGSLGLPARPYEFFLSEARLALSDGREFSKSCSDDFVRLNFATGPVVLEEVLERMRAAVERAG